MELRYRREAAVGLMLIVGTLTFVFMMMWLRGQTLRHGRIIRVNFADVGGLKEGDPVRTSGVTVGHVTRIWLAGADSVEVDFDVKNGPAPRADASASIQSQDFFGARFISYGPGSARDPLPDGRALRGERVEDISELASSLGGRSKTLLDTLALTSILVARDLRITLASMRQLLATLNAGASGGSQQLAAALEALRSSLQRVDLMLAQNSPAVGDAVRSMRSAAVQADSLTRSLARTSARFDSILAKINSGRGAAGTLLNDSTIVQELMTTNTTLRALLEDIRANPGRYFRLRL